MKRSIPRFAGVVHLKALPGDPCYRGGGFGGVEEAALADARALAAGGADGVIVENFGSAPFRKGTRGARIPPHQVAALALIARDVRVQVGLWTGVNCLRNDARAAIAVAAAAGLAFIRVNVHTGASVTDQGIIEGEASETLRYRAALGVDDVAILADVLVKHAAPLAPIDPARATRDALDRGLADAVIVTGAATGGAVEGTVLAAVREAAGTRPVLIGSGLTPENAPALCPLADGAIVGTWLKRDGRIGNPVDPDRVRAMAAALRALRRR